MSTGNGTVEKGSVLEALQQGRDQVIAEREPLRLTIPKYLEATGFEVVVVYGTPGWEDMQEITRQADEKDPRAQLNAEADVLTRACQGIYALKKGDKIPDGLQPFGDGGRALTFEPALADALGFSGELGPNAGAREILFGAFPPDHREWGVEDHYQRLAIWASGGVEEVVATTQGESVGGQK